jgi:hypothetical protein
MTALWSSWILRTSTAKVIVMTSFIIWRVSLGRTSVVRIVLRLALIGRRLSWLPSWIVLAWLLVSLFVSVHCLGNWSFKVFSKILSLCL